MGYFCISRKTRRRGMKMGTEDKHSKTLHLRRRAEELLRRNPNQAALIAPDILELVHELEVHQAELEVQNEELRRAQMEISALQREYEDLYEFAPCANLTLNGKGVVNRCNLTGVRLLGTERVKLRGAGFSSFVAPEYHDHYLAALRRAGHTGEKQTVRLRLIGEGITPFWAAADIRADLSEAGEVSQWRLAFIDVTELRRAEEALNQSSRLLQNTLNAIQDLLTVHDRNLRVVLSNWQGRDHITQEERESFPYCYACYMRRDKPCDPCPTREVFRTGRAVRMEIANPLTHKIFEVSAYPVADASGAFDLVTEHVRDITDIRKAEREREQMLAQFHQSQKMESVGRLAGGVAHDFNNMLGVILGHAEMALEQIDPTQPVYADLQEIHQAGSRSADLVRQLLAFARKQTVRPRLLDFNETISNMIKMLKRLIGENVELIWRPGQELWDVKMDPSQLDQILANLTVNARDAIPDAGRVLIETANVVLEAPTPGGSLGCAPGEYVSITFSDDGLGMSEEILSNIFEPFFTTKEFGKGTGLGLATLYGILKQNGGCVDVSSEQDEGTTFRMYFPRFEREAGNNKTVDSVVKPPMGTGTVLLVEDEEAVRKMGERILERLGYTVLTAGTPVEAISLVKEHQGALVLLITDVIMPVMNGRELAKQITAIKPGLQCLFISGYPADVVANCGVLDEGLHFIQKPFSMSELAKKIYDILGN